MGLKQIFLFLIFVLNFVFQIISQEERKCFFNLRSGPALHHFYDKSGAGLSLESPGIFVGFDRLVSKKIVQDLRFDLFYFPSFIYLRKKIYRGCSFSFNYSILRPNVKMFSRSSFLYGLSLSATGQGREYLIESNNRYSYIANLPQIGLDMRWKTEFQNFSINYQVSAPIVSNTLTNPYSGLTYKVDLLQISTFNRHIFFHSCLAFDYNTSKRTYCLGYIWDFENSTVNNNQSTWATHVLFFSISFNKKVKTKNINAESTEI